MRLLETNGAGNYTFIKVKDAGHSTLCAQSLRLAILLTQVNSGDSIAARALAPSNGSMDNRPAVLLGLTALQLLAY